MKALGTRPVGRSATNCQLGCRPAGLRLRIPEVVNRLLRTLCHPLISGRRGVEGVVGLSHDAGIRKGLVSAHVMAVEAIEIAQSGGTSHASPDMS